MKKVMRTKLAIALALVTLTQSVTADPKKTASEDNHIALSAEGDPTSTAPRCVIDHEMQLVWELKTDDDSVHDKDKIFRWGGVGAESIDGIIFKDWNVLINAANKNALCGFTDWRVPAIDELMRLYSLQKNAELTHYFINTQAAPYWSVSAYEKYPEHAQTVHFGSGISPYYNGYRGNPLPVHLVRGGGSKPR